MSRKTIGVVVNGATGRMGYRQHLVRSLLAIRAQGGLELPDGAVLWPEPVLVGRSVERLKAIADRHGLERWTTSLDEALADPDCSVYFDAQVTAQRVPAVLAAIDAGKHVYVEKPTADSLEGALRVARAARDAGLVHGVVADKLYLPGLLKLRRLIDGGFFGRILSVRINFGYWVFEGDWQPAQRPSWNYRDADGGGIALDMFPHWHYLLTTLVAPVESVYCQVATHIPTRWDEQGQAYEALLEVQVDGTLGSAVAGLRTCTVQDRAMTPRPVWNPDVDNPERFRDQWAPVPDNAEFDNGFKAQWELFLTAAYQGTPFRHDLFDGARGVQLALLALESARAGCRLPVPPLDER
ncbi:MAG: oxidoreductase [Actinobacteria bacterium 13_1_20CM_3_71_11]|nr:MAG: oxidoreductase [Actinobacteria bacterium 13_1_20CM_3_71_11]